LPGPEKLKRPNLAISSLKKATYSLYFGKMTRFKVRISLNFASPKQGSKYTIFFNIKNEQMDKSFYFWQTV